MFEKTTWIKLPRNVLVGHGVLDDLAAAVEDLYLSGRPLVVTSPTPNDLVGDRVRAQFDVAGTTAIETASFDAVERVVAAAEDAEAGYLIGLGGGKPIDTAKMASDRLGCGFVSVPTAASHDGIVSGRSSIPEGDTRHSVAADPPPHEVLGVEPDASQATVQEAYRKRVQTVHPDKPTGDEERFKRVKRAREVMTDDRE